jgi:hypothetical protein
VSIHYIVVVDAWGESLPGWPHLLARLKSGGDGRRFTIELIGIGDAVSHILSATALSSAPSSLSMPHLTGQGPADTSHQLLEAVIDAGVHLDFPEVIVYLLTDPRLDDERLADLSGHPSIAAIRRVNGAGVEEDITARQKLLAEQRPKRRATPPSPPKPSPSNSPIRGGQGSTGRPVKLPLTPVTPPPTPLWQPLTPPLTPVLQPPLTPVIPIWQPPPQPVTSPPPAPPLPPVRVGTPPPIKQFNPNTSTGTGRKRPDLGRIAAIAIILVVLFFGYRVFFASSDDATPPSNPTAVAPASGSDEEQITQLAQAWTNAFNNHDLAGMQSLMCSGSASDLPRDVFKLLDRYGPFTNTVSNIKVTGNTATAGVRSTWSNSNGNGGEAFDNTYAKEDGVWKICHTTNF